MIVRVRSAAVAGIGNSFDVGKVLLVDMGMFPPTAAYHGFVSIIQVQCSNISSATTATLRICRDTGGDECLVTDTASSIFTGLTTATKGTACFAVDGFLALEENDQFYCFVKTNAGTIDVDYVEIVWADKG